MNEGIKKVGRDALNGDKGQAAMYAVELVVDGMQNKKELTRQKLRTIESKEYGKDYCLYKRVILENFVERDVQYYGSEKRISIYKIKDEIEDFDSFQRNIVITGQAGSGKSTLLEWLFLNSYVSGTHYKFFYAKKFKNCHTLEEVFSEISKALPKDKRCIVFFDGFNELPCIKGTSNEFISFIEFIDKECNPEDIAPERKFIVSTRTEFFEFNNIMTDENVRKNFVNYVFYELGKLKKDEMFQISIFTQKLYKIDKEKFFSNYIYNWPSKEDNDLALTEKDYIELLKLYLKRIPEEELFLDTPLLCNFAYQIVYVWNLYGKENSVWDNRASSQKIKKIIEIYMKHEFREENILEKTGEYYKDLYDRYEVQVLDFLTELAASMGESEYIDREQWRNLKHKKGIEKINRAFFLLQEVKNIDSEKLMFVHKTFRSFFLARYFASPIYEKTEEYKKKMRSLFNLNSEFAGMYIEELLKGKDETSKRIIKELLREEDNNIDEVIKYAIGDLWFFYNPGTSFTIKDYLTVFPCGVFVYEKIVFNVDVLNKLLTDGILEIADIECLKEFREDVVTEDLESILKGLQVKLSLTECMTAHFWMYLNGKLKLVHGFESIHYDEDIAEIDGKKSRAEHNMLIKTRTSMINFLGEEKDDWCLFDGTYLYVYRMIPQNEESMSDLFLRGFSKNAIQYITFYGIYKAMTDNELFLQEGDFKQVTDVLFKFDSDKKTINIRNDLYRYYDIHYEVHRLFKRKMNFMDISNESMKLCDEIENILKDIFNEKLKLYFLDEQLYVLYMIGEGERMESLAKDTIELCGQYGHTEGIRLRNFLMQDELCFIGEDLQKLYQFAKNHIWI